MQKKRNSNFKPAQVTSNELFFPCLQNLVENYYLHGPDSIVWQNVLVVQSDHEVTKSFRL